MRRVSSRTDVARNVLEIASRVLSNVKAGRVYDAKTVEWAETIVRNNGRPLTARAGNRR